MNFLSIIQKKYKVISLNLIFYIFIALIALSILVFFHELGHYTVAKFFGVKVERFSIGFGKVLFRKNWLDTEWAFAPILLGGYVKMKGQDDINPLERSSDPDSYNSKKPWQRILILLAGPFANILLAFFIYFGISLYGIPTAKKHVQAVVGEVAKDYPAYKAGFKSGDKILYINKYKISDWEDVSKAIQESNTPLNIKVLRENKEINLTLNPTIKNGKKIIGIGVDRDSLFEYKSLSFFEAIKSAYRKTKDATFMISKGVGQVATGEVDSKNIGGAITIFDLIIKMAKEGFVFLLSMMAIISVNLGVLNLLPIPALDGGHIVFNLYELITKRAPSEKILYSLTLAGWVFLIGLMFFGLYNDVNRIWG